MVSEDATEATSRARADLILFACGLACVLGFFLFRAWMFSALTVDDAYITMRHARNLVNGHGFVYNIGGPPVESYTNHTLFLLQAAMIALGLNVVAGTKIVGVLSGIAVVAGCIVLAKDLLRWNGNAGASLLWLLPGAWVLADSPILATGSVAGLETALFAALVTWSVVLVLRVSFDPATRRRILIAGLVVGFMTWTRPEGLAWAIGLLAVAGFIAYREKRSFREIALPAVLPAAFWLSLMIYRLVVFGHPFPNSYYVKMSGAALSRTISGLHYVLDWLKLNGGGIILIAALIGVICARGIGRLAAGIAFLAVCGHLALTAYEGGDWMPHLRLILPCLGVLCGLFSFAICIILTRAMNAISGVRATATAGIVFALFCVAWTCMLQGELKRAFGEVQVRVYGWADGHAALAKWIAGWEHSREAAGKSPMTVAITDIGLVGFYSDVRVIDLAGLADPEWGRTAYATGKITEYPAGHLVLDKKPELIVLMTQTPPTAPRTQIEWYADRAVFQHPDFLPNYKYITTFTHKDFPGDGYFLNLYVRKDLASEAPPANPPRARATNRR